MHIVLVDRCYNDGTAYYNLTFCTKKISNDRFGIKFEKLTILEGIYSIMEFFDSKTSSVFYSTLDLRCKLHGYQYGKVISSKLEKV